jgi:hypothetical protein
MDPRPKPPDPPDPRDGGLLAIVRRWRAMLAAAAVAGGLAGILVAPPSGLRSWHVALLFALGGVLGALALALVFERTGAVLRSTQDADALTGARCLGVLSREAWRASAEPPFVVAAGRSAAAADEYRLLAGKLQTAGARSVALLRVDARAPGMGTQVAAALAERGVRVALIDPEHGGATLLAPGTSPASMRTTESTDVADAAGAVRLVEELLRVTDVVLVDLPSVERPATSVMWASAVDGTLLAAQVGRTTRSGLAAVTESLGLAQAPLLGTVLGAPPRLVRLRP